MSITGSRILASGTLLSHRVVGTDFGARIAMDWKEYWNGPHPIYVNARHRALHFDRIAKDIAALVPGPQAIALDWGCGEADAADALARACGKLYLYDTASTVLDNLCRKFADNPKIAILDDAALAALPDHSLNFVIINSVVQYLSREQLGAALDLLHTKLKPDGTLAIGDVIHVNDNAVADTLALFRFGWEGGFLVAAGLGVLRTIFSDYRRLRDKLGLSRYAPEDFIAILAAHGFSAHRAERNIGHNQGRMLFLAKPA
jgi:ubiquinone/menaquinone biosynthesis C-methylase UbiE